MDLLARAAEGFRTLAFAAELKDRALHFLQQWLTGAEFNPYKPQMEWLIETGQWAGLLDRFYQILPFGTGGRRGAVGIGPNRMNLWTLGASVQGHCIYLKEKFPGVGPLRVVLAYDVRRFEDTRKSYDPSRPNPVLHLSSRDFAQHAAGVYAANGIQAHILPGDSPRYLATPELSFTIRFLQAHGGLNVSASHNPPDDNGGKFYDERGGQPVPPDDQIMADIVDQVTQIRALPWPDAQRSGRVIFLDDGPHHGYIDLIRRQSLVPPPRFDEIQVVFTPLHGVGAMTAMEALVAQGFRVAPVEEQMTPDGQFPNVTKTPNPEVHESMDRGEALARKIGADLLLATDPDADRLGAMIPAAKPAGGDPRVAGSGTRPNSPTHGSPPVGLPWRVLNGNEIGALLTHFKLSKLAESGEMPASPIVVTTEVTTNLITRIARHFGTQVIDNLLVGFKYVAEVLWQLEQNGSYEDVRGTPADFLIACEESHGYLVTPKIRDKDAAGAALLLSELALDLKRRGRTVLDYLEEVYARFGYFRNELHNLVMTGIQGKEDMARMLAALRAAPPKQIAGLDVTEFEDLLDEEGRLGPLKGATDRASRSVLIFRLGDRARLALRPSGTEPKAKCYVEACSAPRPSGMSQERWERVCVETDALARQVGEEFVGLAKSLAR
jgi:phosphoglucomutase/phosphomannomutase